MTSSPGKVPAFESPGMISKLDEALRFQSEALRLRGQRQEVIASNLANADTPGYQSVDFKFADALRQAAGVQTGQSASTIPAPSSPALTRTSTGHLSAGGGKGAYTVQTLYRIPTQASVDGNTVDADAERARFADNAVRYEASLRFLNGQLKTLLSAIQSQ
jgi:flagellar basal-body rod protein FlgB